LSKYEIAVVGVDMFTLVIYFHRCCQSFIECVLGV